MIQPKRMRGLIHRAATGVRRVAGMPEWPVVAGTGLGLLAVVEVILRSGSSGADLSTTMLLALAVAAPLGLVRVQVVVAAVTIIAATFLTLAVSQRLTGAGLVALVAVLYHLGRRQPGWVAALLVAPFPAYAMAAPLGDETSRLLAVLLASSTVAAAGLGNAWRARVQAVERDSSGQALADTLLEHAARGERARIARELHDVVAHHISMVVVQAETARLATPGMPVAGAEQLLAIGDTARAALTEMRRLLGVLREDADTGADAGAARRQPQPGLKQLIELVDGARDVTGANVRLVVRGAVAPLGPGVELTAYRIVQEALTNARRHARGAAVDVELDYTDAGLHLRVRDNGPGPPAAAGLAWASGWAANAAHGSRSSGGHGLLGMRERVAAVGGDLRVGPAPVAGFLVEATLPASAEGAAPAVRAAGAAVAVDAGGGAG